MVYELEDDRVPFASQYVSIFILLINIIVFIIQLFDPTGYLFIYEAAFVPNEFFSGRKTWTIFTSMFMHGSFIHIILNLYFFYVVGDNCEHAMGHLYFLIAYLISGLIGSLLHGIIAIATGFGDIPSLGASGAIMGIIAIYGILFPRNRLRYLFFYGTISARTFILITFITELIYGFISLFVLTGTAHFAHIGGLISGVFFAYVFKMFSKKY